MTNNHSQGHISPHLILQESGFCYDPAAKEPQEVLNDCMFREGLTLTVSALVLIHSLLSFKLISE